MSVLGGPDIIKSGLVFACDAANPKSYTSGSSEWLLLTRSDVTGSLFNGPVYNTYNGGSLTFDGADDRGHVLLSGSVDFSEFTLNAWIRLSSSTTTGIHAAIGANLNAFGLGVLNYQIYFNVNEALRVGVTLNTTTTLETGSWYMLTGVFGQSTLTTYLNGNFAASTSSYFSASRSTSGYGYLFIGTGFRFGLQSFAGDIAQVQLYSRPLSPSEVLKNYNATKGRYQSPSEYFLAMDGFSPATQSWTLGPTFSITDKLYADASGTTTSSFFSFSKTVAGNLWMYCVFNNGAGGGGFGPQNVATIADSSGNIVAAIGYNRLGGRAFHLMNGVGSSIITTVSLDNTDYHLWLNCGENSNIRGWVSTTSTRPATYAEMPRNSYAPMARFYATVPAVSDPNWDNIIISTREIGSNPFLI